MDRRDFLKLLGLGAVAAVLPKVEPDDPLRKTREFLDSLDCKIEPRIQGACVLDDEFAAWEQASDELDLDAISPGVAVLTNSAGEVAWCDDFLTTENPIWHQVRFADDQALYYMPVYSDD